MIDSTRRAATAAIARLVVLACLAAATPGGVQAARPGDRVKVSLTAVRATGTAGGEQPPTVDEAIPDAIARLIPKLRQGFARYELAGSTGKTAAVGEHVELSAGRPARCTATPRGVEDDGDVLVAIAIEVSGADRPCLEVTQALEPGSRRLYFCDGMLEDGTVLFFVSVE